MITINNKEEMQKYYIKEINMYSFNDDVDFKCNIVVDSGIFANDIKAWDIKSRDIHAFDIKAHNINSWDINSNYILAHNIFAYDINSIDINAHDIFAKDIKSWDIKSHNINANNISFDAVCFAYKTFVCNAIIGRRENSKYFCLDSDVVIKNKKG